MFAVLEWGSRSRAASVFVSILERERSALLNSAPDPMEDSYYYAAVNWSRVAPFPEATFLREFSYPEWVVSYSFCFCGQRTKAFDDLISDYYVFHNQTKPIPNL